MPDTVLTKEWGYFLKTNVNVFVLLKKMFTLKCANNCHG